MNLCLSWARLADHRVMKQLVAGLCGLLGTTTDARSTPRHTVGFAYTGLFNDSLRYTAFGCDGPAPFFVQAWFPIEGPNAHRLSSHQLRERHLSGALQRVYEELLLWADPAYIEYDLRYPSNGDHAIN